MKRVLKVLLVLVLLIVLLVFTYRLGGCMTFMAGLKGGRAYQTLQIRDYLKENIQNTQGVAFFSRCAPDGDASFTLTETSPVEFMFFDEKSINFLKIEKVYVAERGVEQLFLHTRYKNFEKSSSGRGKLDLGIVRDQRSSISFQSGRTFVVVFLPAERTVLLAVLEGPDVDKETLSDGMEILSKRREEFENIHENPDELKNFDNLQFFATISLPQQENSKDE